MDGTERGVYESSSPDPPFRCALLTLKRDGDENVLLMDLRGDPPTFGSESNARRSLRIPEPSRSSTKTSAADSPTG